MEHFSGEIGSLPWWLTAVVLVIVLNALSEYVVRAIDAALSVVSSNWRRGRELRAVRRRALVDALLRDPGKQVMLGQIEQRHRSESLHDTVRSIAAFAIGLFLFLIGAPIWTGGAVVLMGLVYSLFSSRASWRAFQISQVLREVQDDLRT